MIRGLYPKLVALLVAVTLTCSCQTIDDPIHFYLGSGGKQEHSIYLVELEPASGTLTLLDSFAGAPGASYLAHSPDWKFIYAQDRTRDEQGNNSLSALERDTETGGLRFVNRQGSGGRGICHVSISKDGRWLFGANYSSGHASALPVLEDGSLGTASATVKGEGSGPVSSRQEGPHAHQVVLDPGQRFLLVPDLGVDKVYIYRFDGAGGSLEANPDMPAFDLAPGAGPRHLVFDHSASFVYILNELNATVTACSWNRDKGYMKELQTISTVYEGFVGNAQPAAIRLHPNGRFVYASTRGDNSCITCFEIAESGKLERIQVMEDVPYWPRDFQLSPDGNWLLAAGRRANELRSYRVDPGSGLLTGTENRLGLPDPSNVLFTPRTKIYE